MREYQRALLTNLVECIFDAETRHHNFQVDRLIDENEQLLGLGKTAGFCYLGHNYGRNGALIDPAQAVMIHPSLMTRMNELIRFRRDVVFDHRMITQLLVKLLQNTETIQEARDALPECLVALDSYLVQQPRIQESAWTIKDSPRDMKLYARFLPKIETYCAMRFLY